jgi:hypothetical protein
MSQKPYASLTKLTLIVMVFILAAGLAAPQAQPVVYAQGEIPTDTPPPAQPDAFRRPLIVVQSYSTSSGNISPGQDFNLNILLVNNGQITAQNVVATFTSGGLIPRDTGGVVSVGTVHPNNRADLSQPLTVSWDVWGQRVASLEMLLTYTDESGSSYSERFNLTFSVNQPNIAAPTATPTPTLTPTMGPSLRPQLVITGYKTNQDILQPGYQFNLELVVKNAGNTGAKRIILIVGGGSSSAPGPSETPGAYGTFAASGEFTNFAPLGSSNIQSIGDLAAGGSLTASQPMIVNVSTNPGAYSMKISFAYIDEAGHYFADEQVITLLVYTLPNVDVNFYMESGPLFTGQPNMLPLQVVNMGKKSAVLGTMKVSAENGQFMNNSSLVGTLEMGGYFTLDAMFTPELPGQMDLLVTVDYTDDFNQPQQITKILAVEVMESPVYEPFPGEEPGYYPEQPVQTDENFWQKALRFIRGLFGLDSGKSTPTDPGLYPEEAPIDPGRPVPQPGKG